MTLCDFEIRVLGNVHRHTVQCVLVINMFTEKIFVFLWLWFGFLALCTMLNIFFWILTLCFTSCRRQFVMKYLELSDSPPDPEKDEKHLNRFVNNFLRPDGVFLLRMIAAHAGHIICAELTYALWLRYCERSKLPRLFEETGSSAVSTIDDGHNSEAASLQREGFQPSIIGHSVKTTEPAMDMGSIDIEPWMPSPPPPPSSGLYKTGSRQTPGPLKLVSPSKSSPPSDSPLLGPPPPLVPQIDDFTSTHYL